MTMIGECLTYRENDNATCGLSYLVFVSKPLVVLAVYEDGLDDRTRKPPQVSQ